MIMTVSNQNYALGGRLAYYWSPDWGDTWIGHPDNPIIVAGEHPKGVPATGFQRTPALLIDEEHNRYIIAYNGGHDASEPARRHTHLAVASRPGLEPSAIDEGQRNPQNLQLELVERHPRAGRSVSLQLGLSAAGWVLLQVFAVDGRLVSNLVDREFSAGQHTIVWDQSNHRKARANPGVYLIRATLNPRGGPASEATCRVVVLE